MTELLPGWERLFKPKWSASDLIVVSGNVADAAFLNAVHIYKHMVGTHFPPSVFDWPATEWLQSYRERKSRVRSGKAHPDEPYGKRVRLFAQPRDDVVPRVGAVGCQPTPHVETVRAAVARTSMPTIPPRASRSTGSIRPTVLSGARAAPTGMLKISEKWGADRGVDGKVQL